jgi:hypothetical protein
LLGTRHLDYRRSMPSDWPVDPGETARSLVAGDRNPRREGAAGLLVTAAWIVDGLHYLHDLDGDLGVEPGGLVLGYEAAKIDMAHARWGTADAIAALDLCAAVLGRLLTEEYPRIDGREMDLLDATRHTALRRHAAANEWLEEVMRDPCYTTSWEVRTAGIHQILRRHAVVAVGAGTVGGGSSADALALQIEVEELLGDVRDFATRHVQSFVARAAAGRFRAAP